eukprot:TRINITY_DN7236_c0_g2_i1.p1 TRINITY_DN7236_c0_g2~~TRINITY_DN7236_c0_g2_i1.p1  ORF type:complete len:193 (-),score=57.25 TRINITY_DN7236_c0_g2_i1:18-596(-)
MGITKLVILGGGGVGKSCITIQLVHNYFTTEYNPTIENSYRTQLMVDDEVTMLDILDTAGQEEYIAMRDQYIQKGEGFVLVFSLIQKESFDAIGPLYQNVLRVKDEESSPVVLVGNKCDLTKERKVTKEDAESLANRIGCPYIETSAKTRYNIEDAFLLLVKEVKKKAAIKSQQKPAENNSNQRKKKFCLIL